MIDRDDNVSVTGRFVNEEHDLAAITMSHKGSDWQELYFFNLKSGQPMVNSLKYLRTGSHVIWDEKNVYYDRYDPSDEGRELLDKAKGQKLYYHKFGTEQSEDKLLFVNPDTTGTNSFNFKKIKDKLFFYNSYKYNGQLYKALSVAKVDSTRLDLENFLIYPNDRKIDITIEQVFVDKVILSTNWNAPNGRVLVVDLNNPNKPVELIPEYDVILRQVNRLGKGKIACIYRNENRDLALIFDLEGKLLKKIDFPEGKKVNNFYENSESADYTDFQVSSFYHPDLWYQLSLSNLTFKPTVEISVPYDPESLETRYVKYTSKDGTQIPMYITCMKDTKLNGKNPTLLYGYGGYGTTVEPSYDDSMALWLIHGGILAVPNVRGGGAVGSDWGLEGRRLKKQNTIDDFIAAAEYLIKENYTGSNHLGATGGSHGALLVGSVVIQKPELFKAVVAEAGPYDMLRFGMFTVGDVSTNINEFGTVTDQNDYINLRSYSPLHNIKEGVKYPNVLLITGDHDDRVPPFHSYKFLATLQQKASSESLYLLYVIAGAGHSGGLTNNDRVDKILYEYAFLYDQLF
jgi:prolyl oligopeptidase